MYYSIPVNRPDEKNYPTFPRQFIVFNKQITVIIHPNNTYTYKIFYYYIRTRAYLLSGFRALPVARLRGVMSV